MPINDLSTRTGPRSARTLQRPASPRREIPPAIAAGLPADGAVGVIWPGAPGPELAIEAIVAMVPPRPGRTGFLDPRPVLLPWRSIADNLVSETGLAADGRLTDRLLGVVGLAGRGAVQARALPAADRLALSLARAMLLYPGLLLIRDLALRVTLPGQLRELARIEAELGMLTGCHRVHLVSRLCDAEPFCDRFMHFRT